MVVAGALDLDPAVVEEKPLVGIELQAANAEVGRITIDFRFATADGSFEVIQTWDLQRRSTSSGIVTSC